MCLAVRVLGVCVFKSVCWISVSPMGVLGEWFRIDYACTLVINDSAWTVVFNDSVWTVVFNVPLAAGVYWCLLRMFMLFVGWGLLHMLCVNHPWTEVFSTCSVLITRGLKFSPHALC